MEASSPPLPDAQPDLVLAALHWLELLGLLGAIGSFVVRRAGRMPPRVAWANPPMHIALGAAFAGGAGLLVATGEWTVALRVAAEAVALGLCIRGRRFVAPFAVFAAAVLPLSGHAAALPEPAGAEFADALHVLSAGMWGGGILALAALRPPQGWAAADARLLVERFGRIAVIAFAVTALTGALRATEQLSSLTDLYTTAYGAVLLLKTAGVAAALVLSALGWRRGSAVAGVEGGVVVAVLGLTALLAAFPAGAR